ncbi:MAG: hypothetical protein RIT28_4780 [Pseudomonadota bacterium]|jgi:hypothetical protein
MTLAEAEALRRTHLTHEARLRSVGALMCFFWVIYLLLGPLLAFLGFYAGAIDAPARPDDQLPAVVIGVVIVGLSLPLAALGAVGVRSGLRLRRIEAQHRTLYAVMLCLWLLSCSVASPLGLWGLFLLYSSAGDVVFSPVYQEARRLTPHMQPGTSLLAWLLIASLVLPVAAFFITLVMGG